MAVTKRTRFEVFRRDDHTCQYCGGRAPDVTLTIDHVVPVALGGSDKPDNLVTACRDCNAGKSSIQPDSPLVQSLSGEAAAYALGMLDKMTRFRADVESLDAYVRDFRRHWDTWGMGQGDEREPVPLPADYEMTLFRWMRMGVPVRVLELAIKSAMVRQNVTAEQTFVYTAGIVWNMVNEREIDYSVTDDTAAVLTHREGEDVRREGWSAGREAGESSGREREREEFVQRDYVQLHIDQMEPYYEPSPFSGKPMFMGLVKRGT